MSQSNASIDKLYQKKTDREHVLDNPDTYTGPMEDTEYNSYIFKDGKIQQKSVKIIPGLYKLFDEAIVNCRDHYTRQLDKQLSGNKDTQQVTYIEISIDKLTNEISFKNDGPGIPIIKHGEHDIWIPEMIFGHLRTSSNYDKNKKKRTGGKNGYGVKLIFIWATEGSIETVDSEQQLKYKQEFLNNLSEIKPPKITKCTTKSYTKITFKLDLKRLNMTNFSDDLLSLFIRRMYDIAAVTDKSVKVKYNKQILPIRNFPQYVDLYIGLKDNTKRAYELYSERWEYCVCLSPTDSFQQVSLVNGLYTNKGGKHVDYIMNQIVKKLTAVALKKKKIKVKPAAIKDQLMIFLRCDIDNPSFDSQIKDYLSTPVNKFGSTCEVSDKFISKVITLGVLDIACAVTELREKRAIKKQDGSKVKTVKGIPKLIDANDAGGTNSKNCMLMLVEGDSAKAGVVSGLSKQDRKIIGVYALKGKLMNVRGETTGKIALNKEISEIKQILGLEVGRKYTKQEADVALRYGKIVLLTDQDKDGSHIKGLCINMFASQWESLLNIPGFMSYMNTPILKAKKGKTEKTFYTEAEYDLWSKSDEYNSNWKIKYYKGLGTSTGKEFKEYLAEKRLIDYSYNTNQCIDSIDMAFNKKRPFDRKKWLEQYDRQQFVGTSATSISYTEFVDKELIHFSKYDCERSIPNIMDGLKTSHRKIMYCAFKRNLVKDTKVAQFSGYVSEHSAYHHGEASLNAAIVGLAQDFTGSNNINLLYPSGQFGTRLQGGKDSASERYIFTRLNDITKYIFNVNDQQILEYLKDDGTLIEPRWYAPIIPLILVNGSKGIGTGFSTDIPSFSIQDIIQYLTKKINKDPVDDISMIPYYNGFKGSIYESSESGKYIVKGIYKKIKTDTIQITELPIGSWTDDYKAYLEKLICSDKHSGIIKKYIDTSTDVNVDIIVKFGAGKLDKLVSKQETNNIDGLEKLLKLATTLSINNMHVFDEEERLKKFDRPQDIIDYYFDIRLELYRQRKIKQLESLSKTLNKVSNKARFIKENLNNTIDLRGMKNEKVYSLLREKKYIVIDNDDKYEYLLGMPLSSVTRENIDKLLKQQESLQQEVDILTKTTPEDIWLADLTKLKENL